MDSLPELTKKNLNETIEPHTILKKGDMIDKTEYDNVLQPQMIFVI